MTAGAGGMILPAASMRSNDNPRIEAREHGLLIEPRLSAAGVTRQTVLDLSSIASSDLPPPDVLEALRATGLAAYPDPSALAARTAIASRLQTTVDRVLLGNGASSLLWTIGRALAKLDSVVLAVMPGPGEFAAAARASGARVVQWRAVERTGHAVDLAQIRELMALEKPAIVSLSAPAWPSGAAVRFESLQLLAADHPECTFVVDQSELELSEQFEELTAAPRANLVCVRSIGTSLALAGLRIGYLWARPELCAYLNGRRPSFDTNSLAQRAAEAWAHQTEFIARRRSRLLADRDRLATVLREVGLVATPSVTGALLVRVTRASEVAAELLSRFNIGVCDCTPYGLPDHLRISGVGEQHAAQLRTAVEEVLSRRGIPGGREA
jgi:histidinol-phosphate/aromatic aminotransferase/cobyric acid decarboxylase-like protein